MVLGQVRIFSLVAAVALFVQMPVAARIRDHSWIGEEVFMLNLEPIVIGAQCCISQRAFLCTGNHDFRMPDMPFRNRPILIEDGAWIGAQTFIGPGVTIGSEAVISAGSIVTKDQPREMRCAGNPCTAIGSRWANERAPESRENSQI